MELWRLYRQAHGPGLDGLGGLHAAGRWHERGTRVVYFGASAGIVILEKLAHIDAAVLPGDLVLARFQGDLSVEQVKQDEVDLHDIAQTRTRGESFLKAGTACVLRVPSIVAPEEHNLVFNPLHPEATKLARVSQRVFVFDGRLV